MTVMTHDGAVVHNLQNSFFPESGTEILSNQHRHIVLSRQEDTDRPFAAIE
jgi:hypothetical protein